jgi:hypothetical protein
MRTLTTWICVAALAAGCTDDDKEPDTLDPEQPAPAGTTARDFTLRIENVAPWRLFKVSSQRVRASGGEGAIGPGEAYEVRFSSGAGQRISFASMLRESNDWFFAPDPAGIELYEDGVPLSGDITDRILLWNAGTEADQEPAIGAATGMRQRERDAGDADADATVRLVPDETQLASGTMFVRPAVAAMIRVTITPELYQMWTLRIENISTTATLVTSRGTRSVHLSPVVWALHRSPGALFTDGEPLPANGLERLVEAGEPDPPIDVLRYERGVAAPLARGVFALHRDGAPLFELGAADRGVGLESLAEDGDPSALASALGIETLETLDGSAQPGEAFEHTFRAEPGDRVSFATMFGASNDWFFASGPEGIELFLGDDPRWGDVTSEVHLYDAGTESDEELDIGPSTGSQQAAADSGGDDSTPLVRLVTPQRYEVPVATHVRVTLTPAPAE